MTNKIGTIIKKYDSKLLRWKKPWIYRFNELIVFWQRLIQIPIPKYILIEVFNFKDKELYKNQAISASYNLTQSLSYKEKKSKHFRLDNFKSFLEQKLMMIQQHLEMLNKI